jgi:hypothetical protein
VPAHRLDRDFGALQPGANHILERREDRLDGRATLSPFASDEDGPDPAEERTDDPLVRGDSPGHEYGRLRRHQADRERVEEARVIGHVHTRFPS